ncbi:SurA N-terminal domain-containing protein [Roseomonas xinghualingensis]|uniref:SurA N-terminal domain-containing protein n=1 Tax=Roseomonas xinghualingensis TaxID=2986475 RepID=UPI0021F24739|nr:peptidylprolyl isomerase [Roseomonas sp. SXEYE001]MCV4206805.1 SurA N-terminal domain-containing protein [Roseomonas sp. SXEYE001]
MITAFRRLAGTWFAKGLFVLLVLSFAVWGIEDVIRNFGQDNAVARVGGEPIELTEAQNAARREKQRLQRQLGPNFEPNDQFRAAVARQALEGLIAARAQTQEARRMGVAVSTDEVRAYTFGIPTFQGADGRFNPLILNQFLRQNDMSEADFTRLVMGDLERQQLVGAIRAGARAPETLTRQLLAFEKERRVAEVAEFPLLNAPEVPDPTEAQLTRFHENNPTLFSAPEYREAALALLSAETLLPNVTVTDAEVEAGLEAQRERSGAPERRHVEQALVTSKEAAEAIRNAWAGGADLATIKAQAEASGGSALDMGEVTRATMPVADIAAAVFALPEGGLTEPLQSPFGWHVMKVTAIQPAVEKPIEELRAETREALAREKAADLSYEEANKLEDALASGATVEEVAQRFGLTPVRVTVDRNGNGQDGQRVELPGGPAARAAVLEAIFANPAGGGPRVAEAGGGFLALDVPNAIPATLRPFASVENEVRRAWMLDARRRAQEERAAALLAAVKAGKPFKEAAREAGVEAVRMGPSLRDPQQYVPGGIPRELLPGIFAAKIGEATMAQTSDGYAVAELTEIVPADLAADAEGLARVKTEVEQAMQNDLETQYAAALRARANVTINQSLMDQVATR